MTPVLITNLAEIPTKIPVTIAEIVMIGRYKIIYGVSKNNQAISICPTTWKTAPSTLTPTIENFLTKTLNKIIIPRERTAPVRDIKNPIVKIVPLNKATKKTRDRFTKIASTTPSSNKVISITRLTNPNLIPGIPMLGINDSIIPMIIAPAVNIAMMAIL